jgi:hypothetical protein
LIFGDEMVKNGHGGKERERQNTLRDIYRSAIGEESDKGDVLEQPHHLFGVIC